MLIHILTCIPVVVCLFWMIVYAIKCREKKVFWIAESVLLLTAIYLLSEANAWIKVKAKLPPPIDTYPHAEYLVPLGAIVLYIICHMTYRMAMRTKPTAVTEEAESQVEVDEDGDEYYEESQEVKSERPIFEDDELKSRFETLMIDEQLFLTQGITLTEIAVRLNTNKTYLSRLVNTNYNMTFPEYLNSMRIDYAEQYILHHREAKQIEIAKACGFPSASAFNNTFKKITGQTPKVWLASKK